MDELTEADRKKVEAMTEAMLNKILHGPISEMKRAAHKKEGSEMVEVVRKIFKLEE
jgi:glutamyl-tRNA reductase